MLTEDRRQVFGLKVTNKTWVIAERKLEAKSDDLFIKDDCRRTVAWPSNKSNFTFSSLFFPPFLLPQLSEELLFERSSPPECFPTLSTLPWGHKRQTTYFCKLMISGWIFAPLLVSCWLFWQKACARPTQQIAQSRDYKVRGGGRGLCLSALSLPQ